MTEASQFLYLVIESNYRHLHVKQIRYHYANEAGRLRFLQNVVEVNCVCTPGGPRTHYPRVKSPVPVHMSFEGNLSDRQDSNLRALASKASEINRTPLLPEIIVGLLGFEPRLKQSKCFVLTVTL